MRNITYPVICGLILGCDYFIHVKYYIYSDYYDGSISHRIPGYIIHCITLLVTVNICIKNQKPGK